MIKPSHIQTILLSFLLVSCAGAAGNANAQSGEPVFNVVMKNPDDQISIQYENGTARIDIYSPTGIGSAALEIESGVMPGEMILHLHLKGLEQFQLTSSQESIRASVSSSGLFNVDDQAIISAGTESPLLPGNPLWMEIDVVSGQAEKKIPLEEGYFEVTVPQEFIRNTGKTIEIEWIDFYR